MDRAIFELNASVDATSLYILICALLDQGEQSITLSRALVQWNGTRGSIFSAAEELIRRGVLEVIPPLTEEKPLHVYPREMWR